VTLQVAVGVGALFAPEPLGFDMDTLNDATY
jgi:hypothetical protein